MEISRIFVSIFVKFEIERGTVSVSTFAILISNVLTEISKISTLVLLFVACNVVLDNSNILVSKVDLLLIIAVFNAAIVTLLPPFIVVIPLSFCIALALVVAKFVLM